MKLLQQTTVQYKVRDQKDIFRTKLTLTQESLEAHGNSSHAQRMGDSWKILPFYLNHLIYICEAKHLGFIHSGHTVQICSI